MAHSNRQGGGKIVLIVAVLVLIGLAVAGAVALTTNGSSTDGASDQPTFTVREGPLSITVVESGTLRPREQIIIKSEVEGQNAILALVAEGTMVKKGDLLVELDASSLQDNKIEQQIRVQNGEAAWIRARENLAVVKNQSEADVAKAELEFQFAKQDLEKYLKGEYPQQLMQAENDITIAEEELQRAEQKRQWSDVLYKEKYISQSELQADELAAKKARLNLEVARTDLDLLKQYTHPRQQAQLGRDVEQKEMALDRTQRKAKADIIQAEADLSAKASEFDRQKSKLQDIEDQIAKTRIHAPADGQVIYASSTQFSWRGNSEPLSEGQTVRERQELIHLPTTGAMIAEIKIHEASLDKVRPGLPVVVTVDALPGKRYGGKVTKVAPLPDPTHVFLNPDLKVYRTEILLTEMDEALRAGMSCTARILVKSFDSAVYVPIQSIVRVNGQPSAYVRQGAEFERVPVEIGLDNGSMVRIISGLEPGQEVMQAPPLDAAAVDLNEQAQTTANQVGDTQNNSSGPAAGDAADQPEQAATATPEAEATSAEVPAETTAQDAPVSDDAAAPAAEGDGDQPQENQREGRGGRPDLSKLTPEQIQQMRQRFEQMSPEERQQAIQQYRQQQSNGQE